MPQTATGMPQLLCGARRMKRFGAGLCIVPPQSGEPEVRTACVCISSSKNGSPTIFGLLPRQQGGRRLLELAAPALDFLT